MKRILFPELPGIAEIERQYLLYLDNKLLKDEREALEAAIEAKSIEFFGITERDTAHWARPTAAAAVTCNEWEGHFEFIEEGWEEEDAFWDFFGIDVTDGNGMQLACLYAFGRQLVCALKQLHPEARLSFRETGQTHEQMQAAAEAWGKRLLAAKHSR